MLSRVGLVLALWLTLVGAARAAEVQVTRTDDPAPDACAPTDCSLREAIGAAQDGDTVRLGGSGTGTRVHDLTRGQLVVTRDIRISGGGPQVSGIDARFGSNRILRIEPGAEVVLDNVSLTGGRTLFEGSDPNAVDGGHALFNAGDTTIEHVVFEDNGNASSVGGAISNTGTLSITDTDFHANHAGFGGAIDSRSGTVAITRSSLRRNIGNSGGAAIRLRGGALSLTNTTIADNGEFGQGGGIVNAGGSLNLLNVTLTGNVNGALLKTGGTTSVKNTVLAAGFGEICGASAITDNLGGNLDEDGTCGFGPPREAHLAPVAGNGGATPTAALLFASDALDAGSGCPAEDQRGRLRSTLVCDSGALEAARSGAPSATTLQADSERFLGSANLAGEAGVLYFEYRPVGTGDWARTPGVGLGEVGTPTTRSESFPPLATGTSYEYRAVAENATGRGVGDTLTLAVPQAPGITQLHRVDVSDTSATLRFRLDPRVTGAGYEVLVDGQPSPLIGVSGSAPRTITRTVTGLQPDTEHELQIVASNWGGRTGLDDGKIAAHTLPRVSGTAGTPLMTEVGCPGDARIEWGDGASSSVPCAAGELTLDHTYASGGRYRVTFAYDGGGRGEAVAVIEPGAGRHVLSVSVTGRGRVTGNGISCPGVCNVELPVGTPVELTATGQDFQGWSDTCQGTSTCAFDLTEHRNVVADFNDTGAVQRTLSVTVSGDGRVTGGGIDCPGTCSIPVEDGTVVALTATAGAEHRFSGWGDACSGRGACSVTLDANRTVGALFERELPAAPGPDPVTPGAQPTPTPTPGPEPTAAVDVVAAPAGGTVLVRLPGTNRFVALKAGQELPYGTEIDTRKGRVTLTTVPKAGAPRETAVFSDGLFKISYAPGGITNLTLSEPLAACPKAKRGRAAAAARKKAKSRRLWGKGKGSFRTTGKYSAATVRGTTWLVQDSCAGTLTRVTEGAVTVRHGKKTVVVRAGRKYLAKPRPAR